MSYYSPSNLNPNSGEIVSSTPNLLSWQINGTIPQTKYNIFIRKVSDNTQIYNSGEVTSSLGQHTLPSGTLTAGIIYKWLVRSFYNASQYTDSDWTIIYASGIPTVTIGSTPTNQQNFVFQFTYSHPQNIAVRTYQVMLYEGSDLIVDSGQIYPQTLVTNSSTPLTYTVSGMLSGSTYKVKCIVINQQDKVIDSGLTEFTVNYTYPDSIPDLIVTPNNEDANIRLSWINLKQIIPTTTGTYEYLNDLEFTKSYTVGADYIGTHFLTQVVGNTVQLIPGLDGTFSAIDHLTWEDLI